MTEWTKEWPTEPGRYWFWGQVSRSWTGKECKPDYFLVKVRRCVNGVMYVTDGRFIYEAEGAKGVWCLAIVPEPPHCEGDDNENQRKTHRCK